MAAAAMQACALAQKLRTSSRGGAAWAVMAPSLAGLKETLKYNKLGDSDLLVSEVTLGTMTWGNQNTEEEAHRQLSFAFDQGINMFDSAEMYPVPPREHYQGSTDRYIATWLKHQPRDKVLVATKVSGYSVAHGYVRSHGGTVRVDGPNVRESVERSLQRLGVDHIDLLQIHWPDRYVPLFGEYGYDPQKEREAVPFAEQLRVFQDLINEGKVRYLGVSNETSLGVTEFWNLARMQGLPKIVSIQNSYSLLVRNPFEVNLAEVCAPRNANVGLLAYSPLAGGALSGKYIDSDSEAAKKGRFNVFVGYMERFNKSYARDAVREYADVAKKHGMTPAQMALAFVRDRWFVTSNIIGATSMEQLKENLSAYTLQRPLSEDVMRDIDLVFKKYRDPAVV
eukprot:jgi/Mesen1/7517/ME000039S06733